MNLYMELNHWTNELEYIMECLRMKSSKLKSKMHIIWCTGKKNEHLFTYM